MPARLAGVSLRNFKAAGEEPLELRLSPITLLYGPNGAGKSSVLQGLHYAREVLRGRLDVDRVERGGSLDLGGFRNILHRRDLNRDMVLGFELELDSGLPSPGGLFDADFDFAQDLDGATQASVELTLRWSSLRSRPFVQRYRVGLEGREFASIVASPDLADVEFTDWDAQHPSLRVYREDASDDMRSIMDEVGAGELSAPFEECIFWRFADGGERVRTAPVRQGGGAVPPLDRVLGLKVAPFGFAVPSYDPDDEEQHGEAMAQGLAVARYLSRIMVGAGIALREALDDLVHLGPLRAVPKRGHRPQTTPDPARWWDGMAAWDRLLTMSAEEVAQVDAWLSGEDRLRSGFGVKVARSTVVPSAHPLNALVPEATVLDLPDLRALWKELPEDRRVTLVDTARGIDVEPGDIGVGVSQILPVVVAALASELRLVAVEQPELHIHPRLQVVLGDLLAETTRSDGEQATRTDEATGSTAAGTRTLLIETHSEHLLLRLLRRIREAREGPPDEFAKDFRPATLSVNYLLPNPEGVRLFPLRIDEWGEFVDRWPEGFFDERTDELF